VYFEASDFHDFLEGLEIVFSWVERNIFNEFFIKKLSLDFSAVIISNQSGIQLQIFDVGILTLQPEDGSLRNLSVSTNLALNLTESDSETWVDEDFCSVLEFDS
jgi:hypothetical protein